MKKYFVFLLMLVFISCSRNYNITEENIYNEIEKGNFSQATKLINKLIAKDTLDKRTELKLKFEKEKMERIRLDFKRTEQDILKYLNKYYPNIKSDDLKKWKTNNKLEYLVIDGEKRYFNNAGPNLFRLDPEAKKVKISVDGPPKNELDKMLLEEIPKVIDEVNSKNKNIVRPVKLTLDYTVSLKPNVIPEGEIVRCWLPYPKENNARQKNIKLISSEPEQYIIADDKNLQRTIYMEKVTEKDKPTVFKYKLSFDSYSEWYELSADKIKPYDQNSEDFKKFTMEEPPHIVFTKEVVELSKKIVGDEKNPYLIAKKIFTFIDENYPWASAREYSTLDNIPMYIIKNEHGDCGIKTLLFMTLCRYNKIPAKWQSGWMLHPPEINLHDWGEVYFEGYGWVPVDQSFGLQNSENEKVKYFYLGGIDSYRFIVNDDISKPFYPIKIFPRSETVDFQRGELEWRGGNLYFDKWNYDMKVEYGKP